METKYVNAEKLAQAMAKFAQECKPCESEYEEGVADTWDNAADFIKNCQAENVAPVVHARWEDTGCFDEYGNRVSKCTNCGKTETILSGFCRECGAEMDGDK